MSVSFSSVAAVALATCGLLGWLRGVRRAALTSLAVLAASLLFWRTGGDLLRLSGRAGLRFHPREQSDLFLGICFMLAVYLFRAIAIRAAPRSRLAVSSLRERLAGAVLGVVNASLLIGGVLRIANPYLQVAANPRTGGWTWRLLSPHLALPAHSSPALTLQQSQITITSSPLEGADFSIPLALVALFGFVIFVVAGTVYGRMQSAFRSSDRTECDADETGSAA
jgi:hypothetical protein